MTPNPQTGEPKITMTPVATRHAMLTEAVIPAGTNGQTEELLVGFIFHVNGDRYFRVFTAAGNLYEVRMDEPSATEDVAQVAARLLARRDQGKRDTG